MSPPEEVADGIWRWTARHPTWHPGDFGAEVASFALRGDDAVVYESRLVPTLEPLLDLGCERVLVTHGPPVLADGAAALREALAAGPWYHRG